METQELEILEKILNLQNASCKGSTSTKKEETIKERQRRELGINCCKCNNEGYVLYVSDTGESMARNCVCTIEFSNKLRIANSGMADLFENYTFDKYKITENWQKVIKQKALEFLETEKQWFYIGGNVGSGKSFICTAICEKLIANNTLYFMSWRDEIVQIKANSMNDMEYQKIMNKLKNSQVLYIDDLFKNANTEADIRIAFEILNYRYINKSITIISSEKTIDELTEIDEAVGSRVYQMAKNYNIGVAGQNKNVRVW